MSRSKPWMVAVALVVALFAATGKTALAQGTNDDIRSSKHNFSAGRDPTFNNLNVANYGEVCVYCHTPHGGQTAAPLWNRAFGVGPYQMYTSPTIEMTIDPQPTGVSLACLSCHDGTIGIDVVTNPPNLSTATATARTLSDIYPSGNDAFKNLGTDLRNDHPISILYDPVADPMFNPVASVTGAGLKLYSGKVQCGTCHNPHNKTNVPFLRRSNTNSDLCLTCHIK